MTASSPLLARIAVVGPPGTMPLYSDEPVPALRVRYPASHGYALHPVRGRLDGGRFTVVEPDECYRGLVNEDFARTRGEDYEVPRYGTEVVLRVGDDPPDSDTHPSPQQARAAFAMLTGDPDGPEAPRPGDTLDLLDAVPAGAGRMVVAAVERLGGDERTWQVTVEDGRVVRVAYGFYRLRERPLDTAQRGTPHPEPPVFAHGDAR